MENEKYDLAWAKEQLEEVKQLRQNNNFDLALNLFGEIKKCLKEAKEWEMLINCIYEESRIFLNLNKLNEAKSAAKKAISISESKLGTNHKSASAPLICLAMYQQIHGDYQKAIELFRKSLYLLDKNDTNTTIAYCGLGTVYMDMANFKLAIKYFKLAIETDNSTGIKKSYRSSIYFNNLGACYRELNNHEEAFNYSRKALKINLLSNETENFQTSLIYSNLAICYYEKANYNKAIELTKKSIKIKSKILKNRDQSFAYSYGNLGLWYQNSKNYKKAITCYNIAFKIFKKYYKNENHLEIALSFLSFGEYYIEIQDYKNAIININKSINSQTNAKTKSIQIMVVGYNCLGQCYQKQK